MIDPVVVSSDLRSYVLETSEMSSQLLGGVWFRWQEKLPGRPDQPRLVVRVCWQCTVDNCVEGFQLSTLRELPLFP